MTETVVFRNGVAVPQEVVEVACVLDRSGSMQSIKNDTIGGFNAFLEEQKKAGASVKMTLTVFSDRVAFMFDAVDIANVPALTPSTYIPNGMTALYDAIGKTIRHIETRFAAIPEAIRPTKVIMAIVTDGEENNSETFTSDIVRELIQAKTSIGWAFVFIGANQDAYAESNDDELCTECQRRCTDISEYRGCRVDILCDWKSIRTVERRFNIKKTVNWSQLPPIKRKNISPQCHHRKTSNTKRKGRRLYNPDPYCVNYPLLSQGASYECTGTSGNPRPVCRRLPAKCR